MAGDTPDRDGDPEQKRNEEAASPVSEETRRVGVHWGQQLGEREDPAGCV